MSKKSGPLSGLKILEFEAIGPGPFCGMMLADMGADVLVVDRPGESGLGIARGRKHDVMLRGRRSVTLDLKSKDGVAAAIHELASKDDIDLVVLSAHGYSGQFIWPYGTVTRNYIEHGTKPVLIIQDVPRSQVQPTAAQIAAEKSGSR